MKKKKKIKDLNNIMFGGISSNNFYMGTQSGSKLKV